MKVIQNLVSSSKYKIKCPYTMNPEFIVVHNTANDASARNEIAYMLRNNNKVSYHYAIDDKEVIQAIPENRNAWHAGDGGSGPGNRKGIGIEICYSKSGGPKFIQAEKNAAIFIAKKLKERKWDISKVKKHQDFSGKYCPHRTLDMGWQRFINMVKKELDLLSVAKKPDNKVKIRHKGKLVEVDGYLKDGRNYVQLNETLTALGFEVTWDSKSKEVVLR